MVKIKIEHTDSFSICSTFIFSYFSNCHDVCRFFILHTTLSYFIICPNGVQCYDRELEGLVETSLNLGIVETTKDAVKLKVL